MNVNKQSIRSDVRRLEAAIGNCHHGGPDARFFGLDWFVDCQRIALELDSSPVDMILTSSNIKDSDIREALVATIRIITAGEYTSALANPGSCRFFASLAIDAYAEEDFKSVRKFLVKSRILCHLQREGKQDTLRRINEPSDNKFHERTSLFSLVKGIMLSHDDGLLAYVEFCDRRGRACTCVSLLQTLHDKRALLLNPDAAEERRRRKEADLLSPILRPDSKYWAIKKKAAACLQKGKLERSTRLYLMAKDFLNEHRKLEETMLHELEWMRQVNEEYAKVCSNLSMISLKQDRNEDALDYADEAISACPLWSKSFCRRALALKSLGKLKLAQVAMSKAIDACKGENAGTDGSAKALEEYKRIQASIDSELEKTDQFVVDNPLYKPMECVSESPGSALCSLRSQHQGVMDVIYSCLEPTEVANLERTSKCFAINADRGRRLAIVTPLKQFCRPDLFEENKAMYINTCRDYDPKLALQILFKVMRLLLDENQMARYLSNIKLDPLSLKIILETLGRRSLSTALAAELFNEVLDLYFESSRDFQVAGLLLRSDHLTISTQAKLAILDHCISNPDEENGFAVRNFFRFQLDMACIRLALALTDYEYGSDEDNLRQAVMCALNNIILVKGTTRQSRMTPSDPLYDPIMDLSDVYSRHFPDTWPGEYSADDSMSRESIRKSFDDPQQFRLWKGAILEALDWTHNIETKGLEVDCILVLRIIHGNNVDVNSRETINCFTAGAFLIARAMSFGGAVSMSTKLVSEDDLSDFFFDFYQFINDYSKGWPVMVKYSKDMLAEYHARSMKSNYF